MIVWQRPNLLLLDEPTNHLDLMTREALAMALNDFDGTVMLVSHDRSLLRSVCEEFWLVSRSGIADFKGDLDEYQRYLIEQSKALKDEQSGKKANKAHKNNPSADGTKSTSGTNSNNSTKSSATESSESGAGHMSRQDKKLDSQKRSQLQRERQASLQPLKKELQET
jgi:ATP-binding cassette subfamily F protein 3